MFLFSNVPEQICREKENPSVLLRRVYDIFIHLHTSITSPESKYENDDVMKIYSTSLLIINAKIGKN
jgi:hypothetical protein